MRFPTFVARRLEDVAEALFPAACRQCGRGLPSERQAPPAARPYAALWNGQLGRAVWGSWTLPSRFVCGDCAGTLRRLPRAPVPLGTAGLQSVTPFAPAPVLFELIHALKYESQVQLAPWFAAFMAAALREAAGTDAMLVPVPLHRRRQAARGFNQSELLAAGIARRLGLALGTGVVERVRDTPPQARLPHAARAANVAAAFRRTGRIPAPGQIIVVDDVVTTGATAAALAAALGADPARIVVAAVCRAGADS